jgi:UDP-N-acetylglucosamine 1-carboxyvinyltransferase
MPARAARCCLFAGNTSGMSVFEITGGNKLKGTVIPQGAKNEALQIVCAVLLTAEPVTITNIPEIVDVLKLIDLLGDMGVKVEKLAKGEYRFQADAVDLEYLKTADYKKKAASLRGSIMVVGPLLARYGKGYIPKPGGDKIGRRRLDTHFLGFQNLGAKFHYDAGDSFYSVEASELKGTYMLLDEASVTGTANIVMAASMAEGTTTIYNAACEPYLQQLCKMINRMGGKISGIGSNMLIIEGVSKLGGCEHRCLPDMIEIGSFIGMAAMTQGDVLIKNVSVPDLGIIPEIFRRMGITVNVVNGDDLHIPEQDHYEIDTFIDGSIMTISDAPWPDLHPT